MRVQDLRLPVKLGLGFLLVLLLTVVVGLTALDRISAMRTSASDLARDQVPSVRLLGQIDAGSGQFRVAQLQEIIADDDATRNGEQQTAKDEAAGVTEALTAYAAMVDGPAEQAMLTTLQADWQHYQQLSVQIDALAAANQDDQALALIRGDAQQANDAVQDDVAKLIEHGVAGAAEADRAAQAIGSRAKLLVMSLLIVAVLLGVGVAWLISRSVTGPVQQVLRALRAMVRGDLRARVAYAGRDEVGQIAGAARAGDAGKGFAVVAGEVKDLAAETAQATDSIGRQVEAIQRSSTAAIDAINSINTVIEQINAYQTTISAAVEQQSGTTAEMNRNIHAASSANSQIAGNIAVVAQAARNTSAGVTQADAAATALADMGQHLRHLIGQFQYQ
jgi:methyl-accepting chemotaxis protein